MTRRDVRAYAHDVLTACEQIRAFTSARSLDDYRSDAMLRSAVERQLIIIGEALGRAAKLEPHVRTTVPDVDRVIAVRNRLVHGYGEIADDIMWTVATSSVPALARAVANL